MRLSMRRRYASFATATALPRTAYLAKCRRVASSFSYRNRPRPRWPLQVSVRHRGLARRLVSVCRASDVAVVTARPHPGAVRRRDPHLEDEADDNRSHVVVGIAPMARPWQTLPLQGHRRQSKINWTQQPFAASAGSLETTQ